jgi:hypothetical protein
LKLEYDVPLSDFAFKFNLRRYCLGRGGYPDPDPAVGSGTETRAAAATAAAAFGVDLDGKTRTTGVTLPLRQGQQRNAVKSAWEHRRRPLAVGAWHVLRLGVI